MRRATWRSCSTSWMRKSTTRACAATCCPPGRSGGTGRPNGGKTPRRCPGVLSIPGRSARPTRTPDGKTFRPSLFVTLTCPSYGRVTSEGTPVDPASYDYARAARDALHFAALFDRFIQNLRRSGRLRRSVFRRDRAATAPRASRPHRDPRHHFPGRTTRGHRRDLSPGVVAVHTNRSASTAATCLSGTRPRQPTSTRTAAKSSRHGTRRSTRSAPTTSHSTSPGSATASTPKVS